MSLHAPPDRASVGPAKAPRLYWRRVRRRVAFVDYFCPHYRRPLFEELARRMEMDFYFFSDARDKWWNSRLPTVEDGDFRRIALRRYRVAGEPFVPALPLRLRPDRYDAVIKNLNGRLMLPSLYGAARASTTSHSCCGRGCGFTRRPRSTASADRSPRRCTATSRRSWSTASTSSGCCSRCPAWTARRSSWPGRPWTRRASPTLQPSRNGRPVVLFVGQFEDRKGIDDLLAAFEQVADPTAELRLMGNGSLEEQIRRRVNGQLAGDDRRARPPGRPARASWSAPRAWCCRR